MQFAEFIKVLIERLKSSYSSSEKRHLLDRLAQLYTSQNLHHWTYLREQEEVPTELFNQMNAAIEQLNEDKPIQKIEGSVLLDGLQISTRDVLIPRPETIEMVEICRDETGVAPNTILDVCTGSAVIALLLKQYFPSAEVHAWDWYDSALATAKKNIQQNQLDVKIQKVNVLETMPSDIHYDLIISNPPYVLSTEMEQMEDRVLRYEPHEALFVEDADPLIFYTRILAFAKKNLNDEGRIYFECNPLTIHQLQEYAQQNNWLAEIKTDSSSTERFLVIRHNS